MAKGDVKYAFGIKSNITASTSSDVVNSIDRN